MCALVLRYFLENGIYVGERYYSKNVLWQEISLLKVSVIIEGILPAKKYRKNFFDYLPYKLNTLAKYMSTQKLHLCFTYFIDVHTVFASESAS